MNNTFVFRWVRSGGATVSLVVFGALLACGVATAAAPGADKGSAPGFYVHADLDLGYDDNVRRTDNDTQTSPFSVLEPTIGYLTRFGKHALDLRYEGGIGRYFDHSDVNYFDYGATSDLNLDLTQKLDVNVVAGWKRDHNTPGEASDSKSDSVDKYNEGRFSMEGIYGRREAKGQVGVNVGTRRPRYTNNDQHYRDRNVNEVEGTFFYNGLGPKTQLLFEVGHTRYDYQTNFVGQTYDLDAKEWRYLVGATWEATGKTTGKLKIGYFDYKVDTNQLDDASGLYYSLGLIWKPKTYSTVDVNLARRTEQTIQEDTSTYVANIYEVVWVHNFSNQTALKTGVEYEKDDYKGGENRQDKLYDFDIGIIYRLTPKYDLGATYSYNKRDSDLEDNDYNANVFMVNLSMRLK